MGFSRQEYWSALPFPSPGDLPISTMTAISIAIAISLIPSHRISRKEVEGGLILFYKGAIWNARGFWVGCGHTACQIQNSIYKTVYLSPSWKRRESWKKNPRYREKLRKVQRLEKEVRVKWKVKRKQHKEKYTPSDFQRDGEINDNDTEMQT